VRGNRDAALAASAGVSADAGPGNRHVYYGWRLVAVGIIAMALSAGLPMSSFGLYIEPLEDEFGWTRAEVSLGFSSLWLASGLAGPVVGRWIDTRGPRSSILLGGVLAGVAFLALAWTQTLWHFYVAQALLAVCVQMIFFIPFQALLSRWFVRRRGLALSILGSGFSLGGLVMVPLVALIIGELGWRASYVLSGVMITAFYLPVGLFVIRNRPQEVGEQPDGDPAAIPTAGADAAAPSLPDGMTLREALRTPLFWVTSVGFMLMFFAMMGWMVHQVPFYESHGMSRSAAATILALGAGAGFGVRLAMGQIADRVDRFEVVVVGLLTLLIAGMVTLLISTSPAAIVLFLVFWVVGSSAGPMVESLVVIRAFGMAHFATILGAVMVVESLGQIVSPSLAGLIYDETGSYDGALVMFIATFSGALVLFFIASRMWADPAFAKRTNAP
jgi:sugar phosphate permease